MAKNNTGSNVSDRSSRNRAPLFYEEGFVPGYRKQQDIDLSDPTRIYRYLLKKVYKQDKYCRDASMILFNHVTGRNSCNIVCGPSGCGKTYVWQNLMSVYEKILIVDSASLTAEGWKGDSKVTSFLNRIDPNDPGYIIVFDEFDKCVAPTHNSLGENYSDMVQSEFLKLVEGEDVSLKKSSGEIHINTKGMTFVLCGSFAKCAGDIAGRESSTGFGFGGVRHEAKSFEKELTMQDIIDFGLIPELASRIMRITNIRPLTLEDYKYLIKEHEGSPVRQVEELYGRKLELSDTEFDDIARRAYESGLGIRNVRSQLIEIMDNKIFEEYIKKEEKSNAF